MLIDWLASAFMLTALVGVGYMVVAIVLVARFAGAPPPPASDPLPGLSVLKPLAGDLPGLYENLASVCAQSYAAPMQIVFGVADAGDPAIRVVERLRSAFPDVAIDLVIDPTQPGTNRKVANLVAMAGAITHDVVAISDADIRLRPHDLARAVATLAQPGVGAVTCLYGGVGRTGVWSDLAALGITSHFLPNAVVGIELGRARPCFGSLIVLRRSTLDAIGGFPRFADMLADDHAIGAAVRERGEGVAVPRFAVLHGCDETSFADLLSHETRWARTVASLDPFGFAGSVVTNPLPFAVAAMLLGGGAAALGLAIAAIACRIVLVSRIARTFALPIPSPVLMPVRDALTFAVFVVSWLGRDVEWRRHRYRVKEDGTISRGS